MQLPDSSRKVKFFLFLAKNAKNAKGAKKSIAIFQIASETRFKSESQVFFISRKERKGRREKLFIKILCDFAKNYKGGIYENTVFLYAHSAFQCADGSRR